MNNLDKNKNNNNLSSHFMTQEQQQFVCSIHENSLQCQIQHIYVNFFKPVASPNQLLFQQIDHAPQQLSQQLFTVEQNCLVINFNAFHRYYAYLFNIVQNRVQEQKMIEELSIVDLLQASDIILAFNGENDRAWNIKKNYLGKKNAKGEYFLNVQWQLGFNAAVCLKNKKSSSYYQYRLLLISKELSQFISSHNFKSQQHQQPKNQKQENQHKEQQNQLAQRLGQQYNFYFLQQRVCKILQREQALIERVLGRYFRNYFCWMYRIKLMQVITNCLQQLLIKSKQYQERIYETVIRKQHQNLHKFIGKYCNDYSAYSYIISFINRYYIKQPKSNSKQSRESNNIINQQSVILKNITNDLDNQQNYKHIHNTLINDKQQNDANLLLEMLKTQIKWIAQLQSYCEVVYSSKQHYRHLLMYKNHIHSLADQSPNK